VRRRHSFCWYMCLKSFLHVACMPLLFSHLRETWSVSPLIRKAMKYAFPHFELCARAGTNTVQTNIIMQLSTHSVHSPLWFEARPVSAQCYPVGLTFPDLVQIWKSIQISANKEKHQAKRSGMLPTLYLKSKEECTYTAKNWSYRHIYGWFSITVEHVRTLQLSNH